MKRREPMTNNLPDPMTFADEWTTCICDHCGCAIPLKDAAWITDTLMVITYGDHMHDGGTTIIDMTEQLRRHRQGLRNTHKIR